MIFISCYNNRRDDGGVYYLKNDSLIPIFEGINCHGLFYDKQNEMLFCATRTELQIHCFKILHDNTIKKIPVSFEKYVFGNDAHGVLVQNNKILLVATNGDPDSEFAINDDGVDDKVGKIIISDLEMGDSNIKIRHSKIINPFNCSHHHHINDICSDGARLFLSSFSHCDADYNYKKKGSISVFNLHQKANVLIDGFEDPHSLCYFKNKLYLTSSSNSSVFSVDPKTKEKKLEYKGPEVYVKGLLVTDSHFYIGLNYSLERTGTTFTNKTTGLLMYNRTSGETKRMSLPPQANNVYSIVSTE